METRGLEKIGSIGAVVAAAACPICFPKLALIGAVFGLGALSAYEYQLLIAAQALVALAVAGSEFMVYAGLAGLVAASVADLWRRFRPKPAPRLESEITCPQCGRRRTETMPADACQFFYECSGCGVLLRPKPGDCCVFCSHGSVKCPLTTRS